MAKKQLHFASSLHLLRRRRRAEPGDKVPKNVHEDNVGVCSPVPRNPGVCISRPYDIPESLKPVMAPHESPSKRAHLSTRAYTWVPKVTAVRGHGVGKSHDPNRRA